MLCWIDIETTGLDAYNDQMLEISAIVTDNKLVAKDAATFVIKPAHDLELNLYVAEMHAKNGLLIALKNGDSIEYAEQQLIRLLENTGCKKGEVLIAGASIHFDKEFLKLHMPALYTWFNHRVFDVSTLKQAARSWWNAPEKFPNLNPGGLSHRAESDVRLSLEEARYIQDRAWETDAGPNNPAV